MSKVAIRVLAAVAVAATLLAGGCGSSDQPSPAETPTPTKPPTATMTEADAEQVYATFAERDIAVLTEVNETGSPDALKRLHIGPALLAYEFQARGRKVLEQPFDLSVTEPPVLRQVWAPAMNEHPAYALTGGVTTSDEGSDQPDPGHLLAWVQEEPEGDWLRFSYTPAVLSEVPGPVAVAEPVAADTAKRHVTAVEHLIAYLNGDDAPGIVPNTDVEEFHKGEPKLEGLTREAKVGWLRDTPDQVGPGGSILAVATEDGQLGIAHLRADLRLTTEVSGGHIKMSDISTAALGLDEEPTEVTYVLALNISYLLAEDGTLTVLGVDGRPSD